MIGHDFPQSCKDYPTRQKEAGNGQQMVVVCGLKKSINGLLDFFIQDINKVIDKTHILLVMAKKKKEKSLCTV